MHHTRPQRISFHLQGNQWPPYKNTWRKGGRQAGRNSCTEENWWRLTKNNVAKEGIVMYMWSCHLWPWHPVQDPAPSLCPGKGSGRWWPKCLGPCTQKKLLCSSWFTPGLCGYWGINEKVEGLSLTLPLLVSLKHVATKDIKTVHFRVNWQVVIS